MTIATPFDIATTIEGETPAYQTSGATYWLRLTKDLPLPPERVTRSQLAQAIDDVFGIENHCTGEKTDNAYSPDTEQSAEEHAQEQLNGQGCQDLATSLSTGQNCAPSKRLGNPLIKNVYAHCSNKTLRGDHVLRSTGSAIVLSGPSPRSKIIKIEIEFSKASYVNVGYYAETDEVAALWRSRKYRPQWVGPVLSGITKVTPPIPHWGASDTVLLNNEISGLLIIYLPIQYDIWSVSVPGRLVGDKRDYTATFIAASQFLDSPADITLEDEAAEDPQADDCSACGGLPTPLTDDSAGDFSGVTASGKDEDEDDEPVESPDTAIGCCDDEEVEYTPYQEAEFTGFSDLPEEVKSQYINKYGPDTEFIGVNPTEPPCGVRIERQTAEDCIECGDVSEVVVNTESSAETVAPSSTCFVFWAGGRLPATVTVSGQGFWLDGSHSVTEREVNVSNIMIHTSADNCGAGTVTIDDGCSTAEWDIRSTAGQWAVRTVVWPDLGAEWFYILLTAESCSLSGNGFDVGEVISGHWKTENVSCSRGGGQTWTRLTNSNYYQTEQTSGLSLLRATPYLDLSTIGGEGWTYAHIQLMSLWEWAC